MKNLLFAAKPLALDLISTLVFVALSALTHNVLLATGVAMAAGGARVVWLRMRGERVNAMQWMSLGTRGGHWRGDPAGPRTRAS